MIWYTRCLGANQRTRPFRRCYIEDGWLTMDVDFVLILVLVCCISCSICVNLDLPFSHWKERMYIVVCAYCSSLCGREVVDWMKVVTVFFYSYLYSATLVFLFSPTKEYALLYVLKHVWQVDGRLTEGNPTDEALPSSIQHLSTMDIYNFAMPF